MVSHSDCVLTQHAAMDTGNIKYHQFYSIQSITNLHLQYKGLGGETGGKETTWET